MAGLDLSILFTSFLAVIVGLVSPGHLAAEAPGVEEQVGGYMVHVSMDRPSEYVGVADFEISILEISTGRTTTNANVLVRIENLTTGETQTAPATTTSTFAPGKYLARGHLDTPGTWAAIIEVSGELGDGQVRLPLIIVEDFSPFSSASLVFVGVITIFILGLAYLRWSVRKAQRTSLPG